MRSVKIIVYSHLLGTFEYEGPWGLAIAANGVLVLQKYNDKMDLIAEVAYKTWDDYKKVYIDEPDDPGKASS